MGRLERVISAIILVVLVRPVWWLQDRFSAPRMRRDDMTFDQYSRGGMSDDLNGYLNEGDGQ